MNHHPIDEMMQNGLREHVFPGAVLLVGRGEDTLFFEAYGQANRFNAQAMTRQTVFDLASLTKPLATTLAVASLVDTRQIDLDRPVATWLPGLAQTDKAGITPRQLLCHRSGLPAHRLFYMTLKSLPLVLRKQTVLDLLLAVPLASPPGQVTLYSDLGFMLLCRLVERVAGTSLDRFLADQVYDPMGIGDLFFVDLHSERRSKRCFAATELCPLRGRLLIGEVHDDNAWYAGGVEGHAGLFGTAEAVFRLLRHLVKAQRNPSAAALFSPSIVDEMLYGNPGHHFSLGFDRPAAENSSAGHYFSTQTVGHLGFTGVSFWMDLKKDMTVILLTNRVHPFRWTNRLIDFRPRIHDRVMEHFGIHRD
ncbi:beta-lactamase [Desulfosarcina variabilis str. Montpellier]|uniref:serine hydrolase domain-containing protein n=1 Tax=Desulfosarcina variabilis TaxID=2300 RepID=UPI003AFB38A7